MKFVVRLQIRLMAGSIPGYSLQSMKMILGQRKGQNKYFYGKILVSGGFFFVFKQSWALENANEIKEKSDQNELFDLCKAGNLLICNSPDLL